MSERIKLFLKFLNSGGLYPCDIFTDLIFECPEQVLASIRSVDRSISLRDRVLCNCFAQMPIDCDCLSMPLLNHLVYIISSFGKHFDLAKEIIEALIERGCDVNRIDADIGSVLHSVICCIDNDIKMNANESEYKLSLQCLDYLLSLNLCHLNIEVDYDKSCKARGTPLALAVERQLLCVVQKLIAFGASVTKTTANQLIIPEVLNEKLIQIFDLLFESGFGFDNDFQTNKSEVLFKHCIQIKFCDWIRMKKCVPLSLKSMARIAIRNSLKQNINDKNLNNLISIPLSLIAYLKFSQNIH